MDPGAHPAHRSGARRLPRLAGLDRASPASARSPPKPRPGLPVWRSCPPLPPSPVTLAPHPGGCRGGRSVTGTARSPGLSGRRQDRVLGPLRKWFQSQGSLAARIFFFFSTLIRSWRPGAPRVIPAVGAGCGRPLADGLALAACTEVRSYSHPGQMPEPGPGTSGTAHTCARTCPHGAGMLTRPEAHR